MFTGNYCNRCGEKVLHDHDRYIGHFFEEAFHFITHFDGKFFTTLKTILTRPGKLSFDFCRGVRRPYFRPLSFFLMLVVIYLLFPAFSGLNMPLSGHMGQNGTYGGYATSRVERYLQSHPEVTKQILSDTFAKKSATTSKLLLFIIIPLTALPLWLLGYRKRPWYYDNLVFATELNSFFILLNFLVFPALLNALHFVLGGAGSMADLVLTILVYAVILLFSFRAITRFYQFPWPISLLLLLVLIVVQTFIVYVLYKFVLFLTVFALL
ncbi:DUF3667 domain-containing protein [Paraflavitalea pollutisoli]|uniref:DUF3667 domain-containing protein n=2 Tax=Bacteroidota TaxID=976 RepID=UPI0023EC176D|nr:DUF3667 domain-containing protein [Paraflavitalea sp. H1-2-19X]